MSSSLNNDAHAVLLLFFFSVLSVSMFAMASGNRPFFGGSNDPWHSGFNFSYSPPFNFKHHNQTRNCSSSRGGRNTTIVVGGSQKWKFGVNYTNWALKHGPFYLYDTLVFKYAPPSNRTPFAHSVYLLPNLRSFRKCDLSKAKMLANTSQGGGEGFKFLLTNWWRPYYFACGERNGLHCNNGTMKFAVMPRFRFFQG